MDSELIVRTSIADPGAMELTLVKTGCFEMPRER